MQSTLAKYAIALSFDDRIARYAVRTLSSLSRNAQSDRDVVVLARTWRPWTEAFFRALELPRLRIHILDMSSISVPRHVRLVAHTTAATLDRLYLPRLLATVDRVLYLDVDLICLVDVGPLFEVDLPDSGIAAKASTIDRYSTFSALVRTWAAAEYRESILNELANHGIAETAHTLNAGVLVMDLATLRRREFVRQALDFVTRYGVNDQFAINLYAKGDFARLDPSWNVAAGHDRSDAPRIIHWVGRSKPWNSVNVPFREQWEAYAFTYDPVVKWMGRFLGKPPVNPLERVDASALTSADPLA